MKSISFLVGFVFRSVCSACGLVEVVSGICFEAADSKRLAMQVALEVACKAGSRNTTEVGNIHM